MENDRTEEQQCKAEPVIVQDYFGEWVICKCCYKPWSEWMQQQWNKRQEQRESK